MILYNELLKMAKLFIGQSGENVYGLHKAVFSSRGRQKMRTVGIGYS